MTGLALKVLKEYGFSTLVACSLLWYMNEMRKDASEERASHTVILVDQFSDLREKVGRCVK